MSQLLVIENFINGEFISTKSHIDSFDPSTGAVWANIPDSEEKDVNKAVNSAKNAFPKYVQFKLVQLIQPMAMRSFRIRVREIVSPVRYDHRGS
jgi:acyl-CoA reductase-like NAD-dependent aldehyde dehydrogenase